MGRVRLAAVVALAAVALVSTGCGERSEPTEAAVPLYPVTVRDSGRPAVLDRAPRRVVAVSRSLARLVVRLGAAKQLVGVPIAGDADGGPAVRNPARFRPDLIVAPASVERERLGRAAAKAHAALYLAPSSSIEDDERAITELGLLLGRPLAARTLVAAIERDRQAVARRLAGMKRLRVFLDMGFYTTVSDRSLVGEMIRAAGGANIAGSTPEPGPFDFGELARRNPQVYLATSDSSTTLASLRSNPKLKRVIAVRKGRFAIVSAALLEPGADVGSGIEALARAIHPDAFR